MKKQVSMGNFCCSMGNWNFVTWNIRLFAEIKFFRYSIKLVSMGNFGRSMGN